MDKDNKRGKSIWYMSAMLLVTVLFFCTQLGGLQTVGAATSSTNDSYFTNTTPFNGPESYLPAQFNGLAEGDNKVFLPVLNNDFLWNQPFGFEAGATLTNNGTLMNRAKQLSSKWVRLGGRISWREMQPNEGDPVNPALLVDFNNELRAIRNAGMTPVVIINDHPKWATGSDYTCAAVRADKFAAYADFIRQVVAYYKQPEFNVHNWELGNEPDVDPRLLEDLNSVFGCWGDIEDLAYYGGDHYGEMLKVVTPVIKAEDPTAKVWIGGLLLNSPDTTDPNLGKPENFLRGILHVGAGAYFDILPYHAYIPYLKEINGQVVVIDHDTSYPDYPWNEYGGGVRGKAAYLRDKMADYGVSKPLFINEIALMCHPNNPTWCNPPDITFFQMQANHLVRTYGRGLSVGLMGFTWYTLDGPGWRNSGLLENKNDPRPAYYAYQQLIRELKHATFTSSIDYGSQIEGYEFSTRSKRVQLVWTRQNISTTVQVPAALFIQALTRDGVPIPLSPSGGYYSVPIGFEPVYIELRH